QVPGERPPPSWPWRDVAVAGPGSRVLAEKADPASEAECPVAEDALLPGPSPRSRRTAESHLPQLGLHLRLEARLQAVEADDKDRQEYCED
ncbi:unnamed protein product, partial [Polarella glacialis]